MGALKSSIFKEVIFQTLLSVSIAKFPESCFRTSREQVELWSKSLQTTCLFWQTLCSVYRRRANEGQHFTTFVNFLSQRKLLPRISLSRKELTKVVKRGHYLFGIGKPNTKSARTGRWSAELWSRAPFVFEASKHDSGNFTENDEKMF